MSARHTIWLTGLSRSGKTTIAHGICEHLSAAGHAVEILDGASVRDDLGDFFGYSKEERMKVSRVLCSMAKILAKHGVIPVVTSITPYQESRDFNRRVLKPYIEVYVECPVETCIERDRNRLYEKALSGDIKHFIGVDDPYELPKSADFKVNTASGSPEETVTDVIDFLTSAMKKE